MAPFGTKIEPTTPVGWKPKRNPMIFALEIIGIFGGGFLAMAAIMLS